MEKIPEITLGAMQLAEIKMLDGYEAPQAKKIAHLFQFVTTQLAGIDADGPEALANI